MGHQNFLSRLITPNKEFALADIDLIFLDHDKLELTVTPRLLRDSTCSKTLWYRLT